MLRLGWAALWFCSLASFSLSHTRSRHPASDLIFCLCLYHRLHIRLTGFLLLFSHQKSACYAHSQNKNFFQINDDILTIGFFTLRLQCSGKVRVWVSCYTLTPSSSASLPPPFSPTQGGHQHFHIDNSDHYKEPCIGVREGCKNVRKVFGLF